MQIMYAYLQHLTNNIKMMLFFSLLLKSKRGLKQSCKLILEQAVASVKEVMSSCSASLSENAT